MFEQRRGRKSSEVYTRDIVNNRVNLHWTFLIICSGDAGIIRICQIMPDSDRRRCVDRDLKEIRIPRNDLIHGRRTGIIITLLPISSETVETGDEEKRKNSWVRARETERKGEKKIKRKNEEDKKRKEKEHEKETRQGNARRTFRSRHPVYRSAVAGPMAWRSRQIIITNHQLFARNG